MAIVLLATEFIIIYNKNGREKMFIMQTKKKIIITFPITTMLLITNIMFLPVLVTEAVTTIVDTEVANLTVPYIHQVYDTPDLFNGNWACGHASMVMILAYYGILDPPPTASFTYSPASPTTTEVRT